ncbi:hypothetical protein F2P81_001381 [Scophthalmus maximus]|uniref:Uncharacterized protein n=1 Tax=Scophthalmus maximus TaxID=52904 RepID=A0A6A4TS27_SCOMX|nr:hypothetical protein F2P81_001381 [Scophthalmus maximus]
MCALSGRLPTPQDDVFFGLVKIENYNAIDMSAFAFSTLSTIDAKHNESFPVLISLRTQWAMSVPKPPSVELTVNNSGFNENEFPLCYDPLYCDPIWATKNIHLMIKGKEHIKSPDSDQADSTGKCIPERIGAREQGHESSINNTYKLSGLGKDSHTIKYSRYTRPDSYRCTRKSSLVSASIYSEGAPTTNCPTRCEFAPFVAANYDPFMLHTVLFPTVINPSPALNELNGPAARSAADSTYQTQKMCLHLSVRRPGTSQVTLTSGPLALNHCNDSPRHREPVEMISPGPVIVVNANKVAKCLAFTLQSPVPRLSGTNPALRKHASCPEHCTE